MPAHKQTKFVARHARKLTHASESGRWTLPELQNRLRAQDQEFSRLNSKYGPLRELLESGGIARFEGGRMTTYTTPVHCITLEDLVDRAQEQIDPDLSLSPGRRSRAGESRAVQTINQKHFQRIRTACRAVVGHLYPNAKSSELDAKFSCVESEYFVWNEADKDWTKFLDLVRDACSGKSGQTTRQYVSSARRLLDLAATHGWIARTSRHDPDYEPVPAAWASVYNRWRDQLLEEGVARITPGLIALFEACSECGTHPTEASWTEVIDHLEDQFRGGDWSQHQRSSTRSIYRELMALDLIVGPDWDPHRWRQQNSITLVSSATIDEIAEVFGRPKKPGETAPAVQATLGAGQIRWPDELKAYSNGLLSGPYGLEQLLLFFTLSASEADMIGLPQRVYPRTQIREKHPNSRQAWTAPTIDKNLRDIFHCAGWMQENLDCVDWTTDDLRHLVSQDNLAAYRRAVFAGQISTKKSLLLRLHTLARIASPFMEAMALRENDTQLADEMSSISRLIASDGTVEGKIPWVPALEQELPGSETGGTNRRVEKIEAAWTQNGKAADFAYQQLARVRTGLLEILEEDHGPLPEQIEAIENGKRFPRSWAREVQEALFWQEQTIVPLRARTLGLLDMGDRRHSKDFSHIWAEIPAWKMKTEENGPFHPNLTKGGSGYSRFLYRLYICDGGARALLCRDKSGTEKKKDMFWVPDVQRFKRDRFDAGGLRRLMRRGLRRALRRLDDPLNGVSYDHLESELKSAGCFGTHAFRHAFATYLVRSGHIQAASKYLHHKGLKTLQEVYSGTTAAHYDVADLLAEGIE